MNGDQRLSDGAKAPNKVGPGPRARNRIAALTAEQVRVQGAIVAVTYLLALVWLQVPEVPVLVRAFVLWAMLALLLGLIVVVSRRSIRVLAATYRLALAELEREQQDRVARETTASVVDQLTGVFSYEYLYARLKEEVDRARRYSRPVTLILVDLAQFHLVNDRLGRNMGNQVLRRFALNILRPAVRATDVVARFGGDEFAILLPETTMEQAATVLARVEKGVARGTLLPNGQRLELAITSGGACYPHDAAKVEDLVLMAEQALRKAKPPHSVAGHSQRQHSLPA